MRTGAASIDITPRVGIELSGFLARVQPSIGIHDRLAGRALFLDDGKSRLLWLHADLIGFDRGFVVNLKKALGHRYRLGPHQIVVSATHTHSGPATLRLINGGAIDPDYVDLLRGKLVDAAGAAIDDAEDTETVIAEGSCGLAIDRRGKPGAHTDHRLGIAAWRRRDGTYAAILGNYPIHHVAMGHENRLISADMAGRAAATVSASIPGNPAVLFTNGACGNLNPPAVGNDFTKVRQWGDQLADCIVASIGKARRVPNAAIFSAATTVRIPLGALGIDEIKACAARVRAPRHKSIANKPNPYIDDRFRDAVSTWERAAIALAHQGRAPAHVPMELQLVRIGNISFVCLAAEVFSIMTDEVRAQTGCPVYIVGYANGDLGYLAPVAAYQEGGYETDIAFVFYGGLPVQRGAFERVRERAVEMVRATSQ